MNLSEMNTPRTWANANNPGAYSLATRVSETSINPGDILKFEQFLTGYGDIRNCKFQCYISSEIFDDTKSWVAHSPYMEEAGNDLINIKWGQYTSKIDNAGFSCEMQGLKTPRWEESTLFFDVNESGTIMTETKSGRAPFEYNLQTKKNIKPGPHYIDFYLTYYNGFEWKSSKERLNFTVNNQFEKHSTLLSALAAAALIVTIAHDGLAPLLETFHDIGKVVSSQRHPSQ